MALDHEAIYSSHSDVVTIDDSKGAFDKDGKSVALDLSKVAAARKAIDDAYAAVKYQRDRAAEYPDWGTQLDYIYHNGIEKWKTDIVDPVKNKYPKPS